MQGWHSNSALFWATEKARVRQPILISSPRLNCYVTPAFSGVPNKGEKIRSGCLTHAFSGAQKRAELLCTPYTGRWNLKKYAKRVLFKTDFAVFWAQKEVVEATKSGAKHTRRRSKAYVHHLGWFQCKSTSP